MASLKEIYEIIDKATEYTINNLDASEYSKKDILKIVKSFDEDLKIDFIFKAYKDLISDVPNFFYENTTTNKSIIDKTKALILEYNPEINLKLLESTKVLNVFSDSYKSTKYYKQNSIYTNPLKPYSIYENILCNENFKELIANNPFNSFLLEELIQSSGLKFLDKIGLSLFKNKALLYNLVMLFRAMSDFYLPLTFYNIAISLSSNYKINICEYYYIIKVVLPKIYEEFNLKLADISFEINITEIDDLIDKFLIDFESSLTKNCQPGEIEKFVTNKIKKLFKDDSENNKPTINPNKYYKLLENLLERDPENFSKENKDKYKETNKSLNKLINQLKEYVKSETEKNKYTSAYFDDLKNKILSRLEEMFDIINKIMDTAIKPFISLENFNDITKHNDEFLDDLSYISAKTKDEVNIKVLNTSDVLSEKQIKFTYSDEYKDLFKGLRKNLLSAYNFLDNLKNIIIRVYDELNVMDIYRINQIKNIIDNNKDMFIKKYSVILNDYHHFKETCKNKDIINHIYKIYIPYLYMNTSLALLDHNNKDLAELVIKQENYFSAFCLNEMKNNSNLIELYQWSNLDIISINLADIIYGHISVVKYNNSLEKIIENKTNCH
ncbi:MAG: hypothetical protein ACI4VF_06165 [Lachnospirales bacterium]